MQLAAPRLVEPGQLARCACPCRSPALEPLHGIRLHRHGRAWHRPSCGLPSPLCAKVRIYVAAPQTALLGFGHVQSLKAMKPGRRVRWCATRCAGSTPQQQHRAFTILTGVWLHPVPAKDTAIFFCCDCVAFIPYSYRFSSRCGAGADWCNPKEALHESVLVVPGRCAKLKAPTSSNFGPSKAPSDAGRRALAPDPWASRPLHAQLPHALQQLVPCHPQI